jgi:hypothetical protein
MGSRRAIVPNLVRACLGALLALAVAAPAAVAGEYSVGTCEADKTNKAPVRSSLSRPAG